MEQRAAEQEQVRQLVELTLRGARWRRKPDGNGYMLRLDTLRAELDRRPRASEIRLRLADEPDGAFNSIVQQTFPVRDGQSEEYGLNSGLALLWQSAEARALGPDGSRDRRLYRSLAAIVIAAAVTAYIVGVVSGTISGSEKIDTVGLGIIAVAGLCIVALVRPKAFTRLQLFEFGSLKLELREIKSGQRSQSRRLEELRLILPILLPQAEQKHLRNLAHGMTTGYKGGNAMRTELRRLREIGLIEMCPGGHTIGEMTSDKPPFDLSIFVRLTEQGKEWVNTIEDVERGESEPNHTDDGNGSEE
jgi:hypothetical protein